MDKMLNHLWVPVLAVIMAALIHVENVEDI